MSLHLNQQCQRAKNTDARSYPLLPGLAGHPCFLRPLQEPVWRPAAVRWPICSTPIRVNILFALLLQSAEKMAEICARQRLRAGISSPALPFRMAISASIYGGFQRLDRRQNGRLSRRFPDGFARNFVDWLSPSQPQPLRSPSKYARLAPQIGAYIINDSRAHASLSPFARQPQRDSHKPNGRACDQARHPALSPDP